MPSPKEDADELNEQVELARAELAWLEEELEVNGSRPVSTPKRYHWVKLRIAYVQKQLAKLEQRQKSQAAYVEWDLRTRP